MIAGKDTLCQMTNITRWNKLRHPLRRLVTRLIQEKETLPESVIITESLEEESLDFIGEGAYAHVFRCCFKDKKDGPQIIVKAFRAIPTGGGSKIYQDNNSTAWLNSSCYSNN